LKDAESEYFKRLSRFGNISVTELSEGKTTAKRGASGEAESIAAMKAEGEKMLKTLDSVNRNNSYVIALDIAGKDLSSVEFADKLSSLGGSGKSTVVFLIGGSHGLSEEAKRAADEALSFGRKTYPHQLMRVILAEQIYRAYMINTGAAYHK
jgi:23S rRNA (pseudouridine1915-N3)-methyltransferase